MNGPPSPIAQNPYCSSASGTAIVNGSTIIATSTSAGVSPAVPNRRRPAVTAPPSRSPNAAVVAKNAGELGVDRRAVLHLREHRHRRLREVARPLERRHEHRGRAVVLERAVEQADRLRDRARRGPVVERDRVAHDRVGVAARVEALRDGLHAEVLGARAVHVHVPARDQRHLLRGRRDAERVLPLAEVAQARARPSPTAGRPGSDRAPYDAAFERLRDRNATTHSAVPLATATAASPSSDAAPPPPDGVRAMKRSSGMPSVVTRLDLGDLLDVVADEAVDRARPGAPASAHAARIASHARSSSVRPMFFA